MTLEKLADQCMKERGGMWEDAAKLMRHRVEHDAALWEELIEPIIRSAIWGAVRMSSSNDRRAILRRVAHQPSNEGLEAVAERMLLDWPLRGGLSLADAKADDLDLEIQWYSQIARSNQRMAVFFERVRKRIRNGRDTVAKVWSEEKLQALMAEIQEE